jgi:hypothetical protein
VQSEDDAALARLKGNHMPWKTIATFFPGRLEGSLQIKELEQVTMRSFS